MYLHVDLTVTDAVARMKLMLRVVPMQKQLTHVAAAIRTNMTVLPTQQKVRMDVFWFNAMSQTAYTMPVKNVLLIT